MKRFSILLLACMLVMGALSACGNSESESAASNKLVVYSPNSEEIIKTIIPMFEKQTGITVELVTAGTGEIVKRLQSEKQNPYADVMFGGSMAGYREHADLYEPYVSPEDENLIEGHRNTTGFATPFVSDGSVLLVNKNLIGDIKIESYADLLNPKLKGKIASADPASSSSAFAQLTNMLKAMGGDYESDKGWDYVSKLIENLNGKIASGSGAVHKSVADGEYVVGLTYEDPSSTYVKNGAPVEVVYPKEGAVFLDAASAVIKGAPHMDNAKKFIDFILSKEAQDAFGTQLTNRPLRQDTKLGDYMTPYANINMIDEDTDYVSANKSKIVEHYIDLFTSIK
ncbi:iron ABC transporter substrate-binding protein [Paenibacillus selenitireducens]|uniref:Iron ABC transporter substrate-binding protein n=1 Tax=Paenibacillus selenitireducens TaxID=1324314 RepID=A0A1T2X8N1_9BACL|nr:ABC transporter substrate-binding protein [Paenibacillus selenitireducens]OPA76247.1 iron ABC transporter substrate-binding protein [Paenibacillus selenitireducens]